MDVKDTQLDCDPLPLKGAQKLKELLCLKSKVLFSKPEGKETTEEEEEETTLHTRQQNNQLEAERFKSF